MRLTDQALRWIYDDSLLQTHGGIKICDPTSPDDAHRERFRSRTVAALELVRRRDPRRYRRIQRHLDYIVNAWCLGTAEYSQPLRACLIDFARFRFEEDQEWDMLLFSCTLVHEATHGLLAAWHVPYDGTYALRAERLCHREEALFACRVMPEADIGEFDEQQWRDDMGSGRWREAGRFITSMIRRARKPGLPPV